MSELVIDKYFTDNWKWLESTARNIHRDLKGKGNYCDVLQEVYLKLRAYKGDINDISQMFKRYVAQEIKWSDSPHNRAVDHCNKRFYNVHPEDLYFDDLDDKVTLEEQYQEMRAAIAGYKQRGVIESKLADLVMQNGTNAQAIADKYGITHRAALKMVREIKNEMNKERDFNSFGRLRYTHVKGDTPGPYLIAGCGPSIKTVVNQDLSKVTVVGVNDSGRFVELDYHVVIDPITAFDDERAHVIKNTESTALFTHLMPSRIGKTKSSCVVDVPFNRERGFLESTDVNKSNNSPFVAACIAIHLGASSIAFAGVDLIGHPNFSQQKLAMAKSHYRQLIAWCHDNGIRVFNLGDNNILTDVPHVENVSYNEWKDIVWK